MAYVGRGIDNISNASLLDAITFTNSAGPYNLTKSSAAFTPVSVQALVISVDGVIQSPDSYTISAATITFGVSMASTLTNDFIVHNGVGIVNEPTDGSVTTAKIEDLAVTTAKLANTNVTAGKLATDAVETAKIKDLNVTAGKLAATQDLSTKTITLPASVSGLGTGITNSQLAGSIDVTTKITGVVPSANLGSGTASSSTILYGDSTYKAEPVGGSAWQSVVTGATLSAVAGNGYPINTTSNACTITLPAGSVGDTIEFVDYVGTWDTNNVTLTTTEKIKGSDGDALLSTERQGVKIVYVDATQGWVAVTGVNETAPALPLAYTVEYLIVAGGGGGGGAYYSGAGGAGGYRTNRGGSGLALIAGTQYTATVGTGGAGGAGAVGVKGVDSSLAGTGITTITSNGGGYGGRDGAGGPGGSGGGAANASYSGGSGNEGGDGGSPSIPEGFDGGDSTGPGGGGGGGASEVGADQPTPNGGAGGDGLANDIIEDGTDVTYAGGGGGGAWSGTGAAGGAGGGGTGGQDVPSCVSATQGTDGLGGGGGGACGYSTCGGTWNLGGDGGDGLLVLRMLTTDYSGTTTGSPTITTDGDYKVLKFTGTGSYTA